MAPSGKKAYVAIGQAGLVWASGLNLGKNVADIRINEDNVRPSALQYTHCQRFSLLDCKYLRNRGRTSRIGRLKV